MELIDLDRPDVGALRAKRWRGLHRDQVELLDRIARDPRTGPDEAAGQVWSAAVIREAPRKTRLLDHLKRTFEQLGPIGPALSVHSPPAEPAEPIRERVLRGLQELQAGGAVHPEHALLQRLAGETQPRGP